ncbi:hypothetical protein [Sulfurospirillum cavolei]|uniref:hypothetical protein n=1 Tax=Sulfurospirillum cavolei TaxID=366522 RepID=UPI0005A80DA6|nr:hypothetical protein [Sulfurospirillum cavolei]
MGKSKLLKLVTQLKEEVAFYQREMESYKAKDDDIKVLKLENKALQKQVTSLTEQIGRMSEPLALYEKVSHYEKARTQIAINHNNVLEAMHRVSSHYKKIVDDFIPSMQKYKDDLIRLSDEFTIPMDKFANEGLFAVRNKERISKWESRSQKLPE